MLSKDVKDVKDFKHFFDLTEEGFSIAATSDHFLYVKKYLWVRCL